MGAKRKPIPEPVQSYHSETLHRAILAAYAAFAEHPAACQVHRQAKAALVHLSNTARPLSK